MVKVQRIIDSLDWEKGGGRVMTILRMSKRVSGNKILHTELFTRDELGQLLTTRKWLHGGVERIFEINSARIDCDADALLLDVVPLVDISRSSPLEQIWRLAQRIVIQGKHCLPGCYDNVHGYYRVNGYHTPFDDFTPKVKVFPVVVTDGRYGVLMVGWMNGEAFQRTKAAKTMWYWSRSKKRLWLKGEESGHFQLDPNFAWHCAKQCILANVTQRGSACHDGYRSCFYREITEDGLRVVEDRLFDPTQVYKK